MKFTGRAYTSTLQRELYDVAIGYCQKPTELTIRPHVDDNCFPAKVTPATTSVFAMRYAEFDAFGVRVNADKYKLNSYNQGGISVELGRFGWYNFTAEDLGTLTRDVVEYLIDMNVEVIETRRCSVKVYPEGIGDRTIINLKHEGTAVFLCGIAGVTSLEDETYVKVSDIKSAIGKNREEMRDAHSRMNIMRLADPLYVYTPNANDLEKTLDEIDRLAADHIKVCRCWNTMQTLEDCDAFLL